MKSTMKLSLLAALAAIAAIALTHSAQAQSTNIYMQDSTVHSCRQIGTGSQTEPCFPDPTPSYPDPAKPYGPAPVPSNPDPVVPYTPDPVGPCFPDPAPSYPDPVVPYTPDPAPSDPDPATPSGSDLAAQSVADVTNNTHQNETRLIRYHCAVCGNHNTLCV